MVHESEKCTTKWGEMGRKNLDFDPFFEVLVQFWYTNRNLWYTFFQGVPRAKLTYFITLIESFLDMASVPTIRVIFDRRKTATAVKKASVEIEVYFNRERTRISTGVSVLKQQWRDGMVVNHPEAQQLNETVRSMYDAIFARIETMQRNGTFDVELLNRTYLLA